MSLDGCLLPSSRLPSWRKSGAFRASSGDELGLRSEAMQCSPSRRGPGAWSTTIQGDDEPFVYLGSILMFLVVSCPVFRLMESEKWPAFIFCPQTQYTPALLLQAIHCLSLDLIATALQQRHMIAGSQDEISSSFPSSFEPICSTSGLGDSAVPCPSPWPPIGDTPQKPRHKKFYRDDE